MSKHRHAWFLCSLLLVACGDDDGGANNVNLNNNSNQDPCVGVTCSGHGACVATSAQAACDCDDGYHADGLTCVVDAGNTAPVITSTPATKATALVEYAYDVTCTDADGDPLGITLGALDTCDATLTDHGDGTALYHFTAETGGTCVLAVECRDASDVDLQTVTVSIAAGACGEDTTFTGQVHIPDPPDPASDCGGVLTSDPFPVDYDAGVGALRALAPETWDATASADATLVGATVVATAVVSLSFRSLWLADATGTIKTWVPEADETQLPAFHVRVGQRVSVRALEVMNYYGSLEITRVAPGTWVLESEDEAVSVPDRTGGPDLGLADLDAVVRLTGSITSVAVSCGTGWYCYDVDYGASAPVVLRAMDGTAPVGTCLTWVGPVSSFNDAPQLRYYDQDWILIH